MNRDLERYMEEVARYPLLDPKEELSLARAFRAGDRAAGQRLVTCNLRFVVKVANGYRGYGLRLADLIQEGNLGLMRAVEKFDPDQGIRLVAYAVWWIRAFIQGHVLQTWSIVKLGTTQAQRKLFFSLSRARQAMRTASGEGDWEIDEKVARELRVCPTVLRDVARRIEGRDLSLDAPLPGDGVPHVDRVADPADPADELLDGARESAWRRATVEQALSQLDERERRIVEDRIMADEPVSLQELGSRLGFSRERARQIELRARGKLRAALRALAPPVDEGAGTGDELLAAG